MFCLCYHTTSLSGDVLLKKQPVKLWSVVIRPIREAFITPDLKLLHWLCRLSVHASGSVRLNFCCAKIVSSSLFHFSFLKYNLDQYWINKQLEYECWLPASPGLLLWIMLFCFSQHCSNLKQNPWQKQRAFSMATHELALWRSSTEPPPSHVTQWWLTLALWKEEMPQTLSWRWTF